MTGDVNSLFSQRKIVLLNKLSFLPNLMNGFGVMELEMGHNRDPFPPDKMIGVIDNFVVSVQ
jgi:hypothetical protein